MCRLKIKIRLTGKRNQKCVRFILVPKDFHQKSNYILSFGYWDLRDGPQYRFIVFNIYKLMYYYMQGATPNILVLTQFYIQRFHIFILHTYLSQR